jgi:hypothetical protein
MNWLEIIELRTANSFHKNLELKISNVLEEFHKSATDHIIKVYNRIGLNSDISIHILHHSNNSDVNGSIEAFQLVSALKDFGLTNHSIWIEKSGE